MLVPLVITSLQTCFSALCRRIPPYECNIRMGRYLTVTPVNQPRRQLGGVRFYSKWYYIRPGVGILARKYGLTLNLPALSGYQ